MFKPIDFDDKIFASSQFRKDEISFNLILTLIQKRDLFPQFRCYSDQKDVIILNTDANHPVVVWTSENFNDFESIYNFVSKVFLENEPLIITAKQSCYQFFQKRNWASDDENTKILGVYKLDKLIGVEKHGYLDCVKSTDVEIVANMIKAFDKEALQEEKHPFSYYLEEANKYTTFADTHKVWKNENGNIVSIGHINNSENTGRIGRIYTIPEERGKSYAKMLVAELAKITLKNNLIPVLYTNFQYEPSNKCYQAIGFELLNTIYTYPVKKIAK